MLRLLRPASILTLLLLLSSTARAQKIEWGAIVRGTFGAPTGITRDSGVVNRFDAAGTGRSWQYTVGGGLLLHLPWLTLDLAPTVGREGFRSDPYTDSTFDSTTARTVTSQREFLFDATTFDLQLAARVPWRVAEGWEIAPGAWSGARLATSTTLRERIVAPTPDSVRFADNARERIVAASSIARSRFYYGLLLDAGYTFPSALRTRLALEARVNAGALADGDDLLHALSVGLNLSVLVGVPPPPPETSAPPPVRDTLQPLSLSLDMIAAGPLPTPALARPERERVRMIVPWPMVTGFAPGSAALPARYTRNGHRGRTPFTVGSLAQQGPDTVTAAVLDLLRLRHDAYPDAVIRLVGRATSERIARARAENVKRYLVESALVDPRVVRVETVVESVEEGVEIASEEPAITEPIVVEWGVRRLRAPTIIVRPILNRRNGIARWELRIERDGRTLLDTAGNGAPPIDGVSRRLSLYNLLAPEPLPPLTATMRLASDDGSIYRASVSLPVGVAREPDTTLYAREFVVLHLPERSGIAPTPEGIERAVARAARLAGNEPSLRGDRSVRDKILPLLPAGTRTVEGELGDEHRTAGWRSVVVESIPMAR